MPLLGAHMSIAGGLWHAIDHIRAVNGSALQIFSKNQRRWQSPPLSKQAIKRFKNAMQAWGKHPTAIHNSYLINLAAAKDELREKSVAAMVEEIERAGKLDIPYLIIHPGAHTGSGIETGIKRIAENLNKIFKATSAYNKVIVLLETTAGQGTTLGSRFEELASIMLQCHHPERLGICLDTCHTYAAGYDLVSKEGYRNTMALFDTIIGVDHLHFFHLNDSIHPLGSKKDRHAHIGQGEIGLQGFNNLINDHRFQNHPMVLETPKGEDLQEDRDNLAVLNNLLIDHSNVGEAEKNLR